MVSPIDKNVGRRGVLKSAGLGVLAAAGSGLLAKTASATPDTAAKALAKMTGTDSMVEGKVKLKLPQIAENGRTVPLTVSVDSPMSDASHVKQIHIVADGNPTPEMITFNLTPGAGKAELSTRVRLGKTQNIIAAAVMNDGSVYMAKQQVKVTIGGCGG